jgi:hypothetical protein
MWYSPTHPPRKVRQEWGVSPHDPPAEGESPSALPLLTVEIAAPPEITTRTQWETIDRQVSRTYLNRCSEPSSSLLIMGRVVRYHRSSSARAGAPSLPSMSRGRQIN